MLPHPLTNFEIQICYQDESKFNGVYSKNNFPKIKDDEFKSIQTHWIALHVNGNNRRASYNAIHFDSFGVENVAKEIKKFIENKNVAINICRIQAYDLLILC